MYVWKRFMLQKEFWVSRVDNNANKLLKRSQTLLGVNEFKVENFLCAHHYIFDFFKCYQCISRG